MQEVPGGFMSIDVFSIQCDALEGAKLAGFKGTEGLNRPFEFELFFTVPVGTDVRGAVGERATLTADRDDGRGPVCWQGILAGARLLHETAERALYRASLVPKLWVLQQYVRSYVHTKKKVDAYVGDTLKDGGLTGGDFDFKTNGGAYPQEEFVCQYRESHLDFVHRWFEREGIYYYFEHGEGAGATEKMVIVDDKAQHGPLIGDGHVRYYAGAGADGSAGECLRELSADFRLLPASVHVSDYNYANPAAPLSGEKAVTSGGQGKIREYGYRVFTEGEAKRLAQVKAQSIACRELVLQASGTYLGLRAGYTFEVEEGPSDLPAKYLAMEVKHAGAVSGAAPLVMRYTGLDPKETYRVDVVAIPADVQYRAPQSTAWPRIYGFENGTVDGPGESQYAQIDDQGRYLVRFKFDTSDLPDGSTSTYLRMMQPHGGTTEGWHFPLRKGTEVMVSFQGGDPDRPVIAGVVPNAVTPSNVTSKNYTQNVLRTGGGNEMVMEDIEGAQFIGVQTPAQRTLLYMGVPKPMSITLPPSKAEGDGDPFNMNFSVWIESRGSAGFNIGGSWFQHMSGSYYLDCGYTATVHYGNSSFLRIDGAAEEVYLAGRTTTINAGRTDTISGGLKQTVHGGGSQVVHGGWEHKVTGNNHDDYGTWSTDVKGFWTAGVKGDINISSTGGSICIKSNGPMTLDAPEVILKCAKHTLAAPASTLKMTSHSEELFGLKMAAGVYNVAATAFKLDVSGVAASLNGLKMEAGGAKLSNTPVDIADNVVKLLAGAVQSATFGLVKLG